MSWLRFTLRLVDPVATALLSTHVRPSGRDAAAENARFDMHQIAGADTQ